MRCAYRLSEKALRTRSPASTRSTRAARVSMRRYSAVHQRTRRRHTNGYSLARQIVFERLRLDISSYVPELGGTVGEVLMEPHRSYRRPVEPLLAGGRIKAMAHITGGGITENLPRVLPHGTAAVVDASSWPIPPLFSWLQHMAASRPTTCIARSTWASASSLLLPPDDAEPLMEELAARGAVATRSHRRSDRRRAAVGQLREPVVNRRLGVLISGRGTNLQALIDAIAGGRLTRVDRRRDFQPRRCRRRSTRAGRRNRGARASRHRGWPSRRGLRSRARSDELQARDVDLVCLAGFMRLVGAPS